MKPRGAGRRSSACRSCSVPSTSARKRTRELFDLAEPIPGPTTERLGTLARELRRGRRRFAVRAAGAGLYHNTAVGDRGRGRDPGHLPQDAHPRRPAVLREVLLHAGRSRVSGFRYAVRANRHAGLLGSVVSGSGPRWRRCSGATSCSIRPRSAGIRRRRSGTAQRSSTPGAPSSARTPSRTGLCRRGESVGLRRPAGERHRVLGIFVRRRPVRAGDRRGVRRTAKPSGGRVRYARVDEVRRNWPFLRDRRIDAYFPLMERWLG